MANYVSKIVNGSTTINIKDADAVKGPSSAVTNRVAAFDGTTGKLLKDSGYTIAKSVPSDAVFTDNNTTYKFTIGTTTKGDSTNGVDLGTLKSETAASSGTTLSLVTTGEKYTWNNKSGSNTAQLQVSDITNKKINTKQSTGNYIQFTGGTNKFTVSDGTNSFDVGVAPSITNNVTGSSLTANNIITGNGNSAVKSSGTTISTSAPTSSSTNSTLPTSKAVWDAIEALPEPMVFKGSLGTGGTITALHVDGTATVGDTYKVITAGTYASKAAKVGDTFICLTKTSTANTWELIPSGDEPSGTVTSITIKATSPIAIDSSSAITSSGTRTLSHANSGVTAGTYRSVTVNATGHVTAGSNPTTISGYGITDAYTKTEIDTKIGNIETLLAAI